MLSCSFIQWVMMVGSSAAAPVTGGGNCLNKQVAFMNVGKTKTCNVFLF